MCAAVVLWGGTIVGRHVPGAALPWVAVVAVLLIAWRTGRRGARVARIGALMLVGLAGVGGGAREWSATQVPTGPCDGPVRVVSDPRGGTGYAWVVVDIGGHRVRAVGSGPAAWALAALRAGERVNMTGTCSPVPAQRRTRDLVMHVTGTMVVGEVGSSVHDGGGLWRAANRVRALVTRGTEPLGSDDRALFLGLVMGDDSGQSRSTVEDFRDSGLAHLCSASGQNVAHLMAAAGPLLRRIPPGSRLAASLWVIALFVFLTRGEPSVLRAAAMAAVAAVNLHAGRPSNGRTVLAAAVTGLLVIDPMLAFSVGFMLSVGATAGLAWLSRPVKDRLGVPGVVAATLAAQLGTLPVALLVFGRVPIVSVVANPVAVPVAGVVMLVGLPLAVVAAVMPSPVAVAVCGALTVPVRFVAWTAATASRLEPRGPAGVAAWLVLGAFVVVRWRRRAHAGRRTHVER